MARKYVSFTADDAISNILDWVDQGNPLDNDSDGGDDLGDLYGEDIGIVVRVVHSDGEVDEEGRHHSADKDKDDRGSSESDSEEPPVKRQKKLLTSNRLVNSLDNSLDPTRYDEITLPKNTTGSNEFEMLTGYLGPKSKQDTPKVYWTTDLQLIVAKTNMKLELIIERFSEKISCNSRYGVVRKTDTTEIYALIAIIYFGGLLGLNNHSHEILFSEKAGHPVFAATMS